jgi:predicted ATP-grasp superfamily ATP-dependent carboligase
MAKKDKSCFVIGPIGDPKSEIREWADKILKYVIQPALAKCGYANTIRSDQISKSGLITFEIVQHLIKTTLSLRI